MSDAVTLSVPTDARFRVLASEVAGKYVELAGGSAADGAALAAALGDAVDRAAAAGGEEAVAVELRVGPAGLEATVRRGGQSSLVTHPLPAQNA